MTASGRSDDSTATLLVFGATGRIGGPLARYVETASPSTRLRLVARSTESAASLRRRHPTAEVVRADYYDLNSVAAAFTEVTGVFLMTPDATDEHRAMINVSAAARAAGTVQHIVRLTGEPIGDLAGVPDHAVPEHRRQHRRAREVLVLNELPVSFLNVPAWFMDNVPRLYGAAIRTHRRIAMPYDRPRTWVAPDEIGEAAARLLLEAPPLVAGLTLHIDNGHDRITFAVLAERVSTLLGVTVRHVSDLDTFRHDVGDAIGTGWEGAEGLVAMLAEKFAYEQWTALQCHTTGTLEQLLGRRPTSLDDWLAARTDLFR